MQVLDLGQVVAGNFCGGLLAYFGADVIKVESPKGDALRGLRMLDDSGTSLWWRSYGRNRRCMTLDLHKEEGRAVVKALADDWADVLIENFRPGVMEKWGLGPKVPALFGWVGGWVGGSLGVGWGAVWALLLLLLLLL